MGAEALPRDIARRVAGKRQAGARDVFKRATFTLDRVAARAKAREWFDLYPKAAYMTEIEFWRELDDGRIEFIIRRLPSAD